MQYRVLISETSISSIVEAEQLRALGAFVPFVPSDPEFNIYAYVPDNIELDLRKVQAIHYFEDHSIHISESEFKSHFDKIEDFNHIEVGDKVKISGYKNLVTEVEEINGDEAVTKINLRGYVYRFHKKLSHLSKSNVIYGNREDTFQYDHNRTLYVDLSEYHCIADPQLYAQEVFNIVLRLKLSHPAYNVSLLNPRFGAAQLFGFGEVACTSPQDLKKSLLNPEDILYSNDFINWTDRCTFLSRIKLKSFRSISKIDESSFKHLTKLSSPNKLMVYRRLRSKARVRDVKMLFNKDRIKYLLEHDDHSLKKRHPDCFQIDLSKQGINVISHDFCVEGTYKSLIEMNQIKIAENLDYYMSILRG